VILILLSLSYLCCARSALVLAIQGDADSAVDATRAIQNILDDDRIDPPSTGFTSKEWSKEAVIFTPDVMAMKNGVSRNLKIYQRGGVGFGGLLESGASGVTIAKLKSNFRAVTIPSGSKAPSDISVGEVQAAYVTRAVADDTASDRTDAILANLMTALSSAKQDGGKHILATAYRSMADFYAAEGKLSLELTYLTHYHSLVKDMDDRGWYADCCRRLISIYTRLYDPTTSDDDTNGSIMTTSRRSSTVEGVELLNNSSGSNSHLNISNSNNSSGGGGSSRNINNSQSNTSNSSSSGGGSSRNINLLNSSSTGTPSSPRPTSPRKNNTSAGVVVDVAIEPSSDLTLPSLHRQPSPVTLLDGERVAIQQGGAGGVEHLAFVAKNGKRLSVFYCDEYEKAVETLGWGCYFSSTLAAD